MGSRLTDERQRREMEDRGESPSDDAADSLAVE
jgi:hypothetical protein